MSKLGSYGMRSLRFKLILASIAVEAVMLSVLVWNSTRITSDAMQKVFLDRVETLIPTMVGALTDPLIQRDYATLDERLGKIVSPESLVYIELQDEVGKIVASRGVLPKTMHLDTSFNVRDHVYDQTFDIALAGQLVGRARYGLSVSQMEATVKDLRNQGALVASVEIVLTIALLITLGALLTNHLRTLALAARTLAGGDYSVRVPVIGRDEVADTAVAFNVMAATMEQDIVNRQRARQVLQQSEQRLRNIIDGLGPGMFVGLLTLDGVVLEANEQALAAAGLKPEDVLGKPVEETYWFSYSEESKQQIREIVARGARGEASRCDVQIRAEEDQFIPLDFSMQPFREATGKVILLVLSAIVITERKQMESALQESETRLRLALDAAHMGTFDWDVPNNHITWSRWHEELWGFKPGEFGGTHEAFSQRIHSDDLHANDATVARCIAEREPYMGEFRVVWPDGSTHWISARGEFTFGADGQPLRMRGAVAEITERKQAEVALLEAKQNLERKVIERTAELQVMQLELHAKNQELVDQNRRVEHTTRLKSEFLANMSHELRTPLNAIIGFSELMHDEKVGKVAENHKEYLGDVLTSAQHLLQLINDVLDLAKVESGKMEFHYAPTDIRKIIGEVCDVLRTLMSRTRMEVTVEVDEGLDRVLVDSSKLKQVLYNYLSNALKFSSEGGQVRVRARQEGPDAYRIEVEDKGIGIKPEDIPRLFAEFQQLDTSASKKYQGTGLGLALTKRIVEAQGGRVGVSSTSGRGSIFYAVLPLTYPERVLPGSTEKGDTLERKRKNTSGEYDGR